MIPRFDLFTEARQPFASARESSEYLKRARDRFSVQNLSYWFLGSSPQMPDRLTWLSTWRSSPDPWEAAARSQISRLRT